MRVSAVVAILLLASLAVAEEAPAVRAPAPQLIDLAIRYVNGDVVTLGDVIDRLQSQRNRPAPGTREQELALWSTALEELTDDLLLVQFAEEKQVRIDRERLSLTVVDQANRSGRGLSLADQARARRLLERREKIAAALSFFDQRSSATSPAELLAAYQQRRDDFRRPARAKVLQIALRPADEAERTAFVDAQTQVFRRAQDAGDAAAGAVAPFLEQLMALERGSPERAALLDRAIAALAALPGEGAPRRQREVVEDAQKLVGRRAALRTPEECEAALTALRARLDGQGVEAFKTAARELSQGARREDGGDMGWVEPGYLAPAMDAQIFAVEPGRLSPVFRSEQLLCLVLVEAREEAVQRPFAEVSGELESLLRRERQAAVRQRATGILRERAIVHDLASLAALMADG